MSIITPPTTDAAAEQAAHAGQRANALRALADLIEAKPELAGSPYSMVELNIFPDDVDQAAHLIRILGGARTKEDHGSYLTVRRDFGACVVLDIVMRRDQVCEQVVVDTKTVATTALSCQHCGVGIACTAGGGSWWHVDADNVRYHACADDSGNVASPPELSFVKLEEQPVTEWRCAPILTNAIGLADARASLQSGTPG